MRKFTSFFFGALTGGLVGGVLALLFAPASGMETRERLMTTTRNFGNEVRQAAVTKRKELESQLAALRSGKNVPVE